MKNPFLWGGLVALAALVVYVMSDRGGAATADPQRDSVVYVCTETGRVVTAPAQPVPTLNPEIGRRTLMPGLYCPKCKAWRPSAPFDVVQRDPNARLCPKHRTPMQPRQNN